MLYDIYQEWFSFSWFFFFLHFLSDQTWFQSIPKNCPSPCFKTISKGSKDQTRKTISKLKKRKEKKVANQLAPNSMLKILKIMLIMKISSPIDLHNPEDFRTIITKKGKKTHWIKNLFKPHLWPETQQEKQLVPSVSWAQYLQWVGIEAKRPYIKSNIHRIFSRRGTCETVTSWVSFECNNGSFPLEAKMFCGHSPY